MSAELLKTTKELCSSILNNLNEDLDTQLVYDLDDSVKKLVDLLKEENPGNQREIDDIAKDVNDLWDSIYDKTLDDFFKSPDDPNVQKALKDDIKEVEECLNDLQWAGKSKSTPKIPGPASETELDKKEDETAQTLFKHIKHVEKLGKEIKNTVSVKNEVNIDTTDKMLDVADEISKILKKEIPLRVKEEMVKKECLDVAGDFNDSVDGLISTAEDLVSNGTETSNFEEAYNDFNDSVQEVMCIYTTYFKPKNKTKGTNTIANSSEDNNSEQPTKLTTQADRVKRPIFRKSATTRGGAPERAILFRSLSSKNDDSNLIDEIKTLELAKQLVASPASSMKKIDQGRNRTRSTNVLSLAPPKELSIDLLKKAVKTMLGSSLTPDDTNHDDEQNLEQESTTETKHDDDAKHLSPDANNTPVRHPHAKTPPLPSPLVLQQVQEDKSRGRRVGGGAAPAPAIPLPKRDDDGSGSEGGDEDEDEIFRQQREEFAKLFGASIQDMIHEKEDGVFFETLGKLEELGEKLLAATNSGSHATVFLHDSMRKANEELCFQIRKEADALRNPERQSARFEIADELEDALEVLIENTRVFYRNYQKTEELENPDLRINVENSYSDFTNVIGEVSNMKEEDIQLRDKDDGGSEDEKVEEPVTKVETPILTDIVKPVDVTVKIESDSERKEKFDRAKQKLEKELTQLIRQKIATQFTESVPEIPSETDTPVILIDNPEAKELATKYEEQNNIYNQLNTHESDTGKENEAKSTQNTPIITLTPDKNNIQNNTTDEVKVVDNLEHKIDKVEDLQKVNNPSENLILDIPKSPRRELARRTSVGETSRLKIEEPLTQERPTVQRAETIRARSREVYNTARPINQSTFSVERKLRARKKAEEEALLIIQQARQRAEQRVQANRLEKAKEREKRVIDRSQKRAELKKNKQEELEARKKALEIAAMFKEEEARKKQEENKKEGETENVDSDEQMYEESSKNESKHSLGADLNSIVDMKKGNLSDTLAEMEAELKQSGDKLPKEIDITVNDNLGPDLDMGKRQPYRRKLERVKSTQESTHKRHRHKKKDNESETEKSSNNKNQDKSRGGTTNLTAISEENNDSRVRSNSDEGPISPLKRSATADTPTLLSFDVKEEPKIRSEKTKQTVTEEKPQSQSQENINDKEQEDIHLEIKKKTKIGSATVGVKPKPRRPLSVLLTSYGKKKKSDMQRSSSEMQISPSVEEDNSNTEEVSKANEENPPDTPHGSNTGPSPRKGIGHSPSTGSLQPKYRQASNSVGTRSKGAKLILDKTTKTKKDKDVSTVVTQEKERKRAASELTSSGNRPVPGPSLNKYLELKKKKQKEEVSEVSDITDYFKHFTLTILKGENLATAQGLGNPYVRVKIKTKKTIKQKKTRPMQNQQHPIWSADNKWTFDNMTFPVQCTCYSSQKVGPKRSATTNAKTPAKEKAQVAVQEDEVIGHFLIEREHVSATEQTVQRWYFLETMDVGDTPIKARILVEMFLSQE